jgi:tetratricopeptide (TPR) repeat protein
MRSVFSMAFPNMRLTTGAPLTIFAVRDEHGMTALAPANWKGDKNVKPGGLFQHGWEKQFAIVRLDVPGQYHVVYHEYVHTLLHSNFRWLPTWLDEGLADFFGNTRFEGKKSYVGAPSERVNHLRNHTTIPLETLLTVNPWSFYRGNEERISTFYAESWALVHYLTFGPDMDHGKKLTQFELALQKGDAQLKAFREVFGDLKAVEAGLYKYVQAFVFTAYVLENPQPLQERDFSARKLTKAETDAEVGGYRLWEHDRAEATESVDRALAEDASLGMAHEEKGFIYFREGKDEDAAKEFSRAYELDNTRYLSQYFTTMIGAKKDTAEQRQALHLGLLKTLQINPQFAPPYVQLAMLALVDGHDAQAFGLSRKAEALEPSRAGYHLLSGEIFLRINQPKQAAEFARYVADRWHGPDHNEAVALWDRIPAEARPADATVVAEVEEQSQAAEGRIKSVKCPEKAPVEVTLEREGTALVFRGKGREMVGFPDTVWYGADHFSLCHHVEGMHAVIRYRPSVSQEYVGDWLSIELRDELPPVVPAQASKDSTPSAGDKTASKKDAPDKKD